MVEGYKTSNRTRKVEEQLGAEGNPMKESVFFLFQYVIQAVKIMIDIWMTNGMRIQQRNLTYQNLNNLIEKLEGVCLILQE